MPTYKLTYYAIRGRGELCRLVFVAAGVEFIDERLNLEEWKTLKPKSPQGRIPYLTIDGSRVMPQSLSIARYLAREFSLAGNTNLEQTTCDVIMETCEDIRIRRTVLRSETDEAKKAQQMKTHLEEELPMYLNIFETMLIENNGGDGFYVGETLSVADLAVYDVMDSLVKKDQYFLSKTPKLAAHRERIGQIPRIKEYLEKRPDTEI